MFIICQKSWTIIYGFAEAGYKKLDSEAMDKFCCRKLAAFTCCVWPQAITLTKCKMFWKHLVLFESWDCWKTIFSSMFDLVMLDGHGDSHIGRLNRSAHFTSSAVYYRHLNSCCRFFPNICSTVTILDVICFIIINKHFCQVPTYLIHICIIYRAFY